MPNPKNFIKVSPKGVTLVELVMTVAILAIVLPGVIFMFITASILNESSRNESIAASHLMLVLEEVKNTNFNNVSQQITDGNWDLGNVAIAAKGLTALENESIDTQVSGTDLLYITVTVNWQEHLRPRTLVMETELTRT